MGFWTWCFVFMANVFVLGVMSLLTFGVIRWTPWDGRTRKDTGDTVVLSIVLVFFLLCYLSVCSRSALRKSLVRHARRAACWPCGCWGRLRGRSRGPLRAHVILVGGQLVPTVRPLHREPFGRGRVMPALYREPPEGTRPGGAPEHWAVNLRQVEMGETV